VEAYIDGLIIKVKDKSTLIQDLEEIFYNLRSINLELNPEKCDFVVPTRNLLDFLVSHQGNQGKP
jgi:hypothetical protein